MVGKPIYIKVLKTERWWLERTCLLICIAFRPKNINNYILTPYSTVDNIANPCVKNSMHVPIKDQIKSMLTK